MDHRDKDVSFVEGYLAAVDDERHAERLQEIIECLQDPDRLADLGILCSPVGDAVIAAAEHIRRRRGI